MTIMLVSTLLGKSKVDLAAHLNTQAHRVVFEDPSIFPGSRGQFRGDAIQPGERFACVLDHPKRQRFATIARRPDGVFKVS